jgi:hypothetical protein
MMTAAQQTRRERDWLREFRSAESAEQYGVVASEAAERAPWL